MRSPNGIGAVKHSPAYVRLIVPCNSWTSFRHKRIRSKSWPQSWKSGGKHCSARCSMSSRAQAASVPAEEKKTGVLFVCLGNICRSPAAEAVFQSLVTKANLSNKFSIDSCGTGGGIRNWYKGAPSYHEGGPADERMMANAVKRGIDITSRSRPLKPQDLQNFDFILGMDFENKAAIQLAADYWASEGHPIPSNYRDKLLMMCSFSRDQRFRNIMEVPDPYWSDDERGFNQVLDMLEDSCQGLLDHILSSKSTPTCTEADY